MTLSVLTKKQHFVYQNLRKIGLKNYTNFGRKRSKNVMQKLGAKK